MHTIGSGCCCFLAEHSGPPVDLAIFVLGPTTLTVNWSAPRLYPDVVISYIIRCAQQDDDSNFVETSREMTRLDATFRDLIPNTTYNCEVYTTSMFGNSTAARDSASTFPRESKMCRNNVRLSTLKKCEFSWRECFWYH